MGRVRVKPPEQLSKHFFSSKEKMDHKNMDHKGEVEGGGGTRTSWFDHKRKLICVSSLTGRFPMRKKEEWKAGLHTVKTFLTII